ncbi:MAG: hypothetical protein JWR39_101 [Devosia sp.]|nr:hypothetical protein [Devosia sp.]
MLIKLERLLPKTRVPWDAVVVTVRESLGRTVADVAAVDVIANFPLPVPAALAAAEELRQRSGLNRIVVMVEDERLWRKDWGELA